MFKPNSLFLATALFLALWSFARADFADLENNSNTQTQVLSKQVVRSVDAQGTVTEKTIVRKIRARTVVDFDEANIEGKLKRPNAAYLLHGANLEFEHLYHIRQSQRARILSSYEYLR